MLPCGQLRFTARAKKVLEMASGQAPGYDHVDTWHILFGLLREGDGVGAMVLFTLGADQYRVGLRVTQLLARDHSEQAPGEGSGLDERARARLLDNPLARINLLDQRLAAVERSLGLQPRRDIPDRVRMQRFGPLCASLAMTTWACVNPHPISSSTDRQPSISATSRAGSIHPVKAVLLLARFGRRMSIFPNGPWCHCPRVAGRVGAGPRPGHLGRVR